MAGFNNAFFERQSIARPPMFDGTEYPYWKTRMSILSETIDAWNIVESGFSRPKVTVDNLEIDKPRDRWTQIDNKRHRENANAKNSIICALDKIEYNRISHCVTTQEIWHILEVTHEGTSQVKESQLATLSN